jgi:hypothetical protein
LRAHEEWRRHPHRPSDVQQLMSDLFASASRTEIKKEVASRLEIEKQTNTILIFLIFLIKIQNSKFKTIVINPVFCRLD